MSGEPTLWEIARRMDRADRRIDEGFAELKQKIDRLDFVPMALYISERDRQDQRLHELEEDKKWNRRQVMGAIIASVVSLLLTFAVAQGGF